MKLLKISDWAVSRKNNTIAILHDEDLLLKPRKPHILMMGGVHGDEPEGVHLAEQTLKWLQQNRSPLKWSVSIVTCLNPDGFQASRRVNGNGVDLNRNYPSKNWSAEFDQPRYYPGPSPGSEPEIQAVVAWVKKTKPRLIVHFHSWRPCVVLTGPPGEPYAKALSESSGYPLQNSVGYPTPGGLSQWGWFDNNTPIICTEENDQGGLEKTWERFGPGLIKILTALD